MEKNTGRVRKIAVSDKKVFCNDLAKNLCELQIPYVQVGNEFHFCDVIYKFFDFVDLLNLYDDLGIFFTDTTDNFLDYALEGTVSTGSDVKQERQAKTYTRKMMKQDNRMMRQKLKSTYRK